MVAAKATISLESSLDILAAKRRICTNVAWMLDTT
jgi:hypothetical protein